MVLLFAIAACWEPSVTGPNGMAGVVLDEHGVPMAGTRVESIEQGELTDAEGLFSVSYKDPSQYVMLKQGQTWYRRSYQPTDDGQVVRIQLPARETVELRCDVSTKCALELDWELTDGLRASINDACEPGKSMSLVGVPAGKVPEVVCTTIKSGVAVPVEIRAQPGRWTVARQPTPVRVSVELEEGGTAKDCTVTIGGRPTEPSGEGYWVGAARGGEAVFAVCGGWPTVPVALGRPPEDGVALSWLGAGPTVNLPTFDQLYVVRTGPDGWGIRLAPHGGVFRLPPLIAGRYRLLSDVTALVADDDPRQDARPGVAVFSKGTGILVLDRDLRDGQIEVEGS